MLEHSHRGDHERDTRLVHRIGSFSDLVIGFSLALLALTLAIPDHTRHLIEDPSWLVIYMWTFAVVASIWFNHQRVFSAYFAPTRLTIGLNFALLALVGLVVFFVQVFGKQHGTDDKGLAFYLYWITLGSEFGILGALYATGARLRWPLLSAQQREEGVVHAIRGVALCLGTYAGIALAAVRGSFNMKDSELIIFPIAAALAISAIVKRRMRGRFS